MDFYGEGIPFLGANHEGVHAFRVNRHVGEIHAHDGEYVAHGFEYVMDDFLLHDGRLGLLHDEAVFAEGFFRTLVEFASEETFAGADGVGAIDDDDVIEIFHRFCKSNAIAHMDVKFLRLVQKYFGNGGEILLRQLDDALIDFAQIYLLHRFVAAHFAGHAAVTAADDEDALGMRMYHQWHMGNHFMIGPFVFDGSLENAVKDQHTAILLRLGDLDLLIGARLFVEHVCDGEGQAYMVIAPLGNIFLLHGLYLRLFFRRYHSRRFVEKVTCRLFRNSRRFLLFHRSRFCFFGHHFRCRFFGCLGYFFHRRLNSFF